MKRDWRIIRRLLLKAEGGDYCPAELPGVGASVAHRHAVLLADAGWVEFVADAMGEPPILGALTLAGHEAATLMRDENRLASALERIEAVTGGGAPSDVLLSVLREGVP